MNEQISCPAKPRQERRHGHRVNKRKMRGACRCVSGMGGSMPRAGRRAAAQAVSCTVSDSAEVQVLRHMEMKVKMVEMKAIQTAKKGQHAEAEPHHETNQIEQFPV